MDQRIVCWFRCGAASAVATKLAIAENAGRLPIVVARCVVREEHTDNDRFAADCEKWFGVPVLNLIADKYDGSIYEVFKRRGYISGVKGAPCTLLLKKEVRQRFELPTDRHVFGYCAEEQGRWDDFLAANNINAVSPLMDRGVEHKDCLAMVQDAGIRLPTMYQLGYKHNNCIGCCKATGQGDWNKKIVALSRLGKQGSIRDVIGIAMLAARHANRKDRAFVDDPVRGRDTPAIVRIDRER